MNLDFHFKATGIGSVPWTDVQKSSLNILRCLPEIPFWPQLVQRSHLEDMLIQFSQGLPALKIQGEKKALILCPHEMESELVAFYDHFLAEDIDYFGIGSDYAPGLHEIVARISQEPTKYGPYVKGQTVGPVTFAAGVKGADGKSVLHNPDLLEAMTKGLAIKALWQVKVLQTTNKKPIIFLDEPYLSGFGSAFSSIERDTVIYLLKEVMDYLREKSDIYIGIHCCGNTDWSMILETGPDIVNFDAFSYMDFFMLYPDHIIRFIQGGGTIAWGIVPTADFTGDETLDGLYSKLDQGLRRLYEWGMDPKTVVTHSMLTPACGLGTMEQASAQRVLDLLSMLSQRCRDIG